METVNIQKIGIKITDKNASLILIYRDDKKLKKHVIKLTGFNENSNIIDYLDQLKVEDNHKAYFKNSLDSQILRLLSIVRDKFKGHSLQESIEKNKNMDTINPEEDLNVVDEETLFRKKAVMEETFLSNQKKPSDPDFQYDIVKEFDNDVIESNNWDSEDNNSGF